MTRFRINIDKHMFEVAEQRPNIWKHVFLNQYMGTGMTFSQYFAYLSGQKDCSPGNFHGRLINREGYEERVRQYCQKFVWSVTDCRQVVVNLCVILEHLQSILQKHDIEDSEIVTEELMKAVRNAFFEIASKMVGRSVGELSTLAGIQDQSSPTEQIIKLFRTDKIFPEHVDSGATHALLFMEAKGERLEQRNPCEILQSIFNECITKLRGKKVRPEDWIVPQLVSDWGFMKTAHQCCRIPFDLTKVPMQKIDKGILSLVGMTELAPDKALVVLEEQDGPYPSLLLNKVREDLLAILKCSGYKNRNPQGQWDITPYEWKQAFFSIPSTATFNVPFENFMLIQSLCGRVYNATHFGQDKVVGNLANYKLPTIEVKQEKQEAPKKAEKSVRFAPTTKPVQIEAVPKDNSLSIALLIIAAGLVTLQLRR